MIDLNHVDDYDGSFLTSSVSHVYQSFCTTHTKKAPFQPHLYAHP